MQRSTLIQLVLIIIGILAAYAGVQYLFSNFIYTLTVSIYGQHNSPFAESAISILLITGSDFLIAYFLLTRSKEWANSLAKRSGITEGFKIVAQPVQVFYFLLAGIAIYALARELPYLLNSLYTTFVAKVSNNRGDVFLTGVPILNALNILVPVILLLCINPLAHYFARKMKSEDGDIQLEETRPE